MRWVGIFIRGVALGIFFQLMMPVDMPFWQQMVAMLAFVIAAGPYPKREYSL